ncbi:MAG TPA: class IV adenylate cyclase [Isosphaeraceae bacterium]|nr:class IV adenylate cyclase [Isosphaeraceae bacterium]
MNSDWRFADSQDTVALTLERILRGDSSLVLVTHDAEDGGWQFLDGEHVFEEDGATVLLGEMVQFDPGLLELADLPEGWCAWRAAPDRAWQRAQGEPTSTPDRPPIDLDSGVQTARNIEIKAHVLNTGRLRATLEAMSDTEAEVLNQQDVFFAVATGRLKLRIMGDRCGELIHYDRPDTGGPKVSHYRIAPEVLMTILSRVLPIVGTVRKKRLVYRVGQTRIYLDQVENLGDFVDLEVVLRPDQTEEEGVSIAENLMSRLEIPREQHVRKAYIALLQNHA